KGEINLSWSSPGDDGWNGTLKPGSMFKIEYSTSSRTLSSGAQIIVSTQGVNPLEPVSFIVDGLNNGATYYFGIFYCDEEGNWSGISNMASAVTIAEVITEDLGEKSGFSAINTLNKVPIPISNATQDVHTAQISWQNSGSAKFSVMKSTNNSDWATIADNLSFSGTDAVYNDTGLFPSTTYYYSVFAYTNSYSGPINTSTAAIQIKTKSLPSSIKILMSSATVRQSQEAFSPSFGKIKVNVSPGTIMTNGYILINTNAEYNLSDEKNTRLAFDTAWKNLTKQGKRLIYHSAIELHLYDLTGSIITGNFNQPMELVIPYPDRDGDGFLDTMFPPIEIDSLKICALNVETMKWEIVPGEQIIDKINKTISVKLSHFSVYALASFAPFSQNLESVNVYPNPYSPGSGTRFDNSSLGEGIVFDKLTAKAKVRIFNVAGELVAELDETDGDGRYLWDIRNQSGNKVASGVYIYLVTNPDDNSQKAKGKFAIIK
ncbi:MAG: hypothetical protein NT145_07365, partial [Elusimicrobia bacterium]|nr:hypothetical protein [Elusimicrobiota bacterium]